VGMGVTIPIFLIMVQTSVSRRVMGSATSALQFSRTIGGAFGVNIMGGVLSAGLAAGLIAVGLDPTSVSVDSLLNPLPGTSVSLEQIEVLRDVLTEAMRSTFFTAFIAAMLGLFATLLAPKRHLSELALNNPDLNIKAETETQPAHIV
jgi:hypothetical protein